MRLKVASLMMEDRHRFPPAAPEGMAAHSHPQDRPAAPVWCGRHLRSDRRTAAVRELKGPGDLHQLLSVHCSCAKLHRSRDRIRSHTLERFLNVFPQ